MSGSRTILVLVLGLVVGAIAGGLYASSGEAPDVEALQKQIQALTNRVNSLEQQLAQIKAGGAPAAAAQPNQELENQAMAAYREIDKLVNDGKVDDAKKQLAEAQQKYASSRMARQFQRMGAELSVVGKSAPPSWGIEKWYQGQSDVKLDSGKPTVLVFWETWCPHCRREVPKLQKFYEDFKGKGLQLVGLTKVTRSATDEGVKEFIEQQSLGYPVAKEDGSLSSYFNVSGVPAAAILKDGKVVWRGHPVRITDEMLNGLL